MSHHFTADAAATTAAAASAAPVDPRFDGRHFVPVRTDHLAELLRVQAEHGRLLALIAGHLGITRD